MRKTRVLRSGAAYHVVARANRSEYILNSPEHKEIFLQVLKRAKKKFNFKLNHFCIMGNHIHLFIEPAEKTNLSNIMQWILSVFAKIFNRIHNYKGHVWYDRFKSKIINNFSQFFNTFQYISNNPVKASICETVEDYAYGGVAYRIKNRDNLLDSPDLMVKICLNSI